MKLNPDCIRDILLTVEENVGFGDMLCIGPDESSGDALSKYSMEELYYHIEQCRLSGLIKNAQMYLGGGASIGMLTPDGHEFLANVQTDTNWSKTKEIASKVGSTSLSAIAQIASEVITNLIKGNF